MLDEILQDLLDEQAALDAVVAPIDADAWQLDTPSDRWVVADQIGHLTFFDNSAALAIDDTGAFVDHRAELFAKFTDPVEVDEHTLGAFRKLGADQQLTEWRAGRANLERAAHTLGDADRVEWYGPSMSSKSFLTARLMEVWAHGQDVVDALRDHGADAERPDTDRLRHIAQLGFITRGWSYKVRGEDVPDDAVLVELRAPSGDTWTWGEPDAAARIEGPAGDFCRVVTQRRHVDDTELELTGEAARDWMLKAQAFAGGPTDGPPARNR